MVDYACITWRNISIYSLFKTMGMFRQRGNQSAPCYPELVTVSTNNLRKGIVLLSLSISTVETLHIPEISNCRGSSTHLHLPTFPLVMPGGNDYLVMIYSFNSAWEQSSQLYLLYSHLTLFRNRTLILFRVCFFGSFRFDSPPGKFGTYFFIMPRGLWSKASLVWSRPWLIHFHFHYFITNCCFP